MNENVKHDLSARMKSLIASVLEGQPQWTRLEKLTGTKAIRWRQFCSGLKNPTVEMIEALARVWPQYAFWLATGISDEDAGHIAPVGFAFPGKLKQEEPFEIETYSSIEYFKACQRAASDLLKLKTDTLKKSPKLGDTIYGEESGLGDWLRDATKGLSKKEAIAIMQTLMRAQRQHREETISRMRRNNSDTDQIIDNQRAEELRLKREFGIDYDD